MCLRARKTKRYGQRVPIVSYTNVTVDITCDLCFKQALQFQKPKTKGWQILPPPWAAKGPATPLVPNYIFLLFGWHRHKILLFNGALVYDCLLCIYLSAARIKWTFRKSTTRQFTAEQ